MKRRYRYALLVALIACAVLGTLAKKEMDPGIATCLIEKTAGIVGAGVVGVYFVVEYSRSSLLKRVLWAGVGLMVVGAVMNAIVIVANNGYMPVTSLEEVKGSWMPAEGARMMWLGDWIGGVASLGDVVACVGVFLVFGVASRMVGSRALDRLKKEGPIVPGRVRALRIGLGISGGLAVVAGMSLIVVIYGSDVSPFWYGPLVALGVWLGICVYGTRLKRKNPEMFEKSWVSKVMS